MGRKAKEKFKVWVSEFPQWDKDATLEAIDGCPFLQELAQIQWQHGAQGLLPQNLSDDMLLRFESEPKQDAMDGVMFCVLQFNHELIGKQPLEMTTQEFAQQCEFARYSYSLERLKRAGMVDFADDLFTVKFMLDSETEFRIGLTKKGIAYGVSTMLQGHAGKATNN